tara:strand:+ start:434 stop:2860 length:2427 start_codon:yes stop_codon:yes gene_type:complete
MNFSKISYGFVSVFFVTILGLNSANAFAQNSESLLEEIVVTAQKKEQGLAEVPISIQVISGDRMDDLGITSFDDLQKHIPGVMINKGAASPNIYIRGVGSGTNKGFSQSVTQFIDGMAIARGEQYSSALLDIERVEVLKGTQGVLFGKNTIGGVVNLISRSPDIGGDANGNFLLETVPEWNTTKFQGATNIPVSDTFAMRIAASVEETDGWTYNALLNEDGPRNEKTAVRATFLWELDNLEVNLKVSSASLERRGQQGTIRILRSPVPLGVMAQNGFNGAFITQTLLSVFHPNLVVGVPGVTYQDDTNANTPTGGDLDNDSFILNMKSTIGDFEIRSTTSFSTYDYAWGLDADFGPLPFLATDNYHDFESLTHEMVIVSPASDSFEYLAGIYYEDNTLDIDNNGLFKTAMGGLVGAVFPAPDLFALNTAGRFSAEESGTHTIFDETSQSLSAFFEGTWYLNDKTTVIAGVRVSEEDKDVKGSQVNSSSATGGWGSNYPTLNPFVRAVHFGLLGRLPYDFPKQSRSENHTTPSFKMIYEMSDTTRFYASYAEGYKTGGFDGSENAAQLNATTPAPAFQFEPEEATTLEIGAKIDNPEKNFRFNIAYFSTDYEDMQVSAFDGSAFRVSNAAEAEITGIEIDSTWAPSSNLLIGASATTLDFEYTDFLGSCTGDQNVAYAIANSSPGGAGCQQDMSGKAGNFAPELSASIFAEYYTAMAGNELVYSIAANYVDEFNSSGTADPLGNHDESTKVDVSVKYVMDNGLELKLFGRNITDEVVGTQSIALPLNAGSFFQMWEKGKEVGLSVRKRF